ncbi:MAG: MASE3 domain-containing protein [Thermodesulfobacteriota bacterium]
MQRTISVATAILLMAGIYATSLYNYLLFHSVAEAFSVVIASGIFMVAWNTRRFASGHFLLFLGIAYLFVGFLDFVHTLAYTGMNVFPGIGPNPPTQLWIAARYMESLTLLAAPLMLRRGIRPAYYFLFYAAASALAILSIFVWRVFPDCFIPGAGLTRFKIVSEYVIVGILAAAGAFMWHRREHFEKGLLAWTLSSIAVTILSELAFTAYASVYGFANLLGHILKILSFYLIYKAVIETGLARPYDLLFRDLHRQRERFRVTLTSIGDAVIATDAEGGVTFLNPAAESLTGWTSGEAAGRAVPEVFRIVDGRTGEPMEDPLTRVLRERRPVALSGRAALITREGRSVPIDKRAAPILDGEGNVAGAVLVFHDVTEKRRAEEALKVSLAEKEVLLKEIHHRVKNNLQMVSSLLNLQAQQAKDPSVGDIFQEVIQRIQSMAMVHETLYQAPDLAHVEFAGYARTLLELLWRTQGPKGGGIRIDTDLKPVHLQVKEAVPCGLILNELFSNAMKHAFRGRSAGAVSVSLREDADGTVSLCVRDDGAGLPPGTDWENSNSLGLRLVKLLTRQLRAEVEFRSGEGEGTLCTIRFKKRKGAVHGAA